MAQAFNIHFDDHGLYQSLNDAARRRIPKAVANVLSVIAAEARKDLVSVEKRGTSNFKARNNWVPRNTQYERARSADGASMKSEIGLITDLKFAEILQSGGTEHPANMYIGVPVGARKGSRGNVVSGQKLAKLYDVAKSAGNKKYFIKKINGRLGIWQNIKRPKGIKLMWVLVPKTDYDDPTYLDVNKYNLISSAHHNLPNMVGQAITRALTRTP